MRDYVKFGCKECGYPGVREINGKLYCTACNTWFNKNVETKEERDARILYLSRLDDAEKLLRMSPPRFDDAEDHFKDFIRFYPNYSDGYWGLVRARYGIKYEVDTNGKTVPCCYKSSYEDFRKDSDFKRALSCAENDKIYGNLKEQAELIAGICEESRKEAGKYNYDIFISFKGKNEELKISDEDQREMNDLYDFLKDEGYSVFFSPRSMHKHTGMYYDAYIFSALQSAKVMIVYGSKPEYFTSTWVQNEWTRFLRMVDNGEKKMGSCIVAYNGFNPYELPHDLRRIQAVDTSQRRFYIDILNSVKKILSEEKKVDTNEELMKQIEALKRQFERDQESNKLKIEEEKARNESEKKAAEKEMEALRKKQNELLEENRRLEARAKREYEERKKASEERKLENDKLRAEIESKAKSKAIEKQKTEIDPDFEIVDGCLKKYKGNKTEVVIPEGVTSIGNYAFFGHLDILSVKIPSSVTNIGNCAFSCCASLPKITIPNSVTRVEENAFSGCSKLEIFVDNLNQIKNWNTKWNPDNCPVRVKEGVKKFEIDPDFEIVDGCLEKYKGKKTGVVIPEGVTSIGNYAFFGCLDILSVKIPSSVTYIGNCAFSCCASLPKITIPSSVTRVEENAFSGCSKLEIFVDNLNQIKNWNTKWNPDNRPVRAKEGAKKFEIDPDFEIVDGCLRKYRGNNSRIIVPNGVTSIAGWAFVSLPYFSSVVVSDSVTRIEKDAFYFCDKLSRLVIGTNVTYIGPSGFGNSDFIKLSRLANVEFKDAEGWYVSKSSSGTDLIKVSADDLKNASTAATYFKNQYRDYHWFKI